MEEQTPDGFSSRSRNQSSLHGFFSHQSHRPPGAAFRRVAADHGDNALFLAVLQQSGRSRPHLLIQRAFKASLLVAVGNPPNGLWRQGNNFGNPRRANPLGHLQQGHCPQDDANLLNTAAQKLLQFLLVFFGDFNTQGRTSHTLSMQQNISD